MAWYYWRMRVLGNSGAVLLVAAAFIAGLRAPAYAQPDNQSDGTGEARRLAAEPGIEFRRCPGGIGGAAGGPGVGRRVAAVLLPIGTLFCLAGTAIASLSVLCEIHDHAPANCVDPIFLGVGVPTAALGAGLLIGGIVHAVIARDLKRSARVQPALSMDGRGG